MKAKWNQRTSQLILEISGDSSQVANFSSGLFKVLTNEEIHCMSLSEDKCLHCPQLPYRNIRCICRFARKHGGHRGARRFSRSSGAHCLYLQREYNRFDIDVRSLRRDARLVAPLYPPTVRCNAWYPSRFVCCVFPVFPLVCDNCYLSLRNSLSSSSIRSWITSSISCIKSQVLSVYLQNGFYQLSGYFIPWSCGRVRHSWRASWEEVSLLVPFVKIAPHWTPHLSPVI